MCMPSWYLSTCVENVDAFSEVSLSLHASFDGSLCWPDSQPKNIILSLKVSYAEAAFFKLHDQQRHWVSEWTWDPDFAVKSSSQVRSAMEKVRAHAITAFLVLIIGLVKSRSDCKNWFKFQSPDNELSRWSVPSHPLTAAETKTKRWAKRHFSNWQTEMRFHQESFSTWYFCARHPESCPAKRIGRHSCIHFYSPPFYCQCFKCCWMMIHFAASIRCSTYYYSIRNHLSTKGGLTRSKMTNDC